MKITAKQEMLHTNRVQGLGQRSYLHGQLCDASAVKTPHGSKHADLENAHRAASLSQRIELVCFLSSKIHIKF